MLWSYCKIPTFIQKACRLQVGDSKPVQGLEEQQPELNFLCFRHYVKGIV